jgi:hypothetical protein
MGKINFGRVLLGGIVAGLVADVLGYVADGVILNSQWTSANKVLGIGAFTTAQVIWFKVLGLFAGFITIWFYAACKPRLGTRYRTALNVALAIWIVAYVLPNAAFMYITGLYPHNLMVLTTLGNLVEVLVGTFIGAAIYRESAVVESAAPKAASV